MPSRLEFIPVVMAGGEGSPLVPLTDTKLKCLLPIGNVPLIYFTLELIERSGFKQTYIFTKEKYRHTIEKSLKLLPLKLELKYITYDHEQVDEGTGIFLRYILTKIPLCDNLLIFGGDLYGYIDSLQHFICDFRMKDAAFSALLSKAVPSSNNRKYPNLYTESSKNNGDAIDELASTNSYSKQFKDFISGSRRDQEDNKAEYSSNKNRNRNRNSENDNSCKNKTVNDGLSLKEMAESKLNKSYRLSGAHDNNMADLDSSKIKFTNSKDIIIIENRSNQLLYMLNEEELDEEGIQIERDFASYFQHFNIFYNLHDLHIYAFKTSFLTKIISQKYHFNSIRSNLIPHILKKQFSERNEPTKLPDCNNDADFDVFDPVNNLNSRIFFDYAYPENIKSMIDHFNLYDEGSNNFFYSMSDNQDKASSKCFSFILDQRNILFRVNSMDAFKYACLDIHMLRFLYSIFLDKLKTANKRMQQTPEIFKNNIIDRNVLISDDSRDFTTKCIIGNNVSIGTNCYMKNCVIFNNVNIANDCHIEDSIICNDTNIGAGSSILKCVVGSKQDVPIKSDINEEIYIGTMTISTED